MKAHSKEKTDAAKTIESLQFELQVQQREIGECRERMEELESRFVNLADPVFITDLDGAIIDVNPAACSLLGYSKQEFLDLNPWDLFTSETREEILGIYQSMLPESTVTVQRKYRCKKGEQLWVDLLLRRADSACRKMLVVSCRDVTKREQTEEALRLVEQRALSWMALRADVSAALSMPSPSKDILGACAEAIVRHLGAAFARIWTLGKEKNVLELQASAGLYTRLDGSHSRIEVGKLKVGLIAQQMQPHLTNDVLSDPRVSDKEWARACGLVSFAGYPLVVEERVIGVMAMFARHPLSKATLDTLASVADVIAQGLERKHVEEALRASEENLRQIFDSIPGFICTTNAAGELELVNQPAIDYTGKSLEELKDWGSIVHPDDLPRVVSLWTHSVITGRPYDAEQRILSAEGEYRWFHARGRPVRNTRGRIIRWYSLLTDIEDRRRAEDELRKVLAELAHVTRVTTMGELAASIAHEVSQPIAGIVINATTCLRWLARLPQDSADLAEAKEAIQRIMRDSKRAGDVIGRIRTLFNKAETAKEPLDINEAIREIMVLTRSEMEKKRVAQHLELADELPAVMGDRVQLQQVMLNLILNAIEAMSVIEDRPRKLVIATQIHERSKVRVTVEDSGPGVAPESMEKVFTAFHTTKRGGLGMGLSISRSIVESHSGQLWVTANDGPGATFEFTLLARDDAADSQLRS